MFSSTFRLDNFGAGNSFIHRLHPAVKVVIMILVIITNTIIANPFYSLAVSLICVMMIVSSGTKLITLFKAYSLVLFMVVGLIISYAILVGLSYQLVFTLWMNLTALSMPILFLLFTSPILKTLYGVEFLLHPLSFIKFPLNAIILISTISLSFIPILIDEIQRILYSMAVRGADIRFVSWGRKIKIAMIVLIPLLISTLNRSETLASAIAVKNYDAWSSRSNILKERWKLSDTVFLLIIVLSFYGSYILIRTSV